jgi:hypothetical protein
VQTAFLRMNASVRIVPIPKKFSLSLDGRGYGPGEGRFCQVLSKKDHFEGVTRCA